MAKIDYGLPKLNMKDEDRREEEDAGRWRMKVGRWRRMKEGRKEGRKEDGGG
jgi:hypothetical protein